MSNNPKLHYDTNGNRLTQNQEVNQTRRFSYISNSNTLTGIKYYHTIDENTTNVTKDINYTYDATGNIIQDEKHTYSLLVPQLQLWNAHWNNNFSINF